PSTHVNALCSLYLILSPAAMWSRCSVDILSAHVAIPRRHFETCTLSNARRQDVCAPCPKLLFNRPLYCILELAGIDDSEPSRRKVSDFLSPLLISNLEGKFNEGETAHSQS